MIDPYSRYQKSFKMLDLTPNIDGKCGCGCGVVLTGRRTRWATGACMDVMLPVYQVIKGNTSVIREQLWEQDRGICAVCGIDANDGWDADHIIPVYKGGGGCTIDGFQTLCKGCHKEKHRVR